MLDEQRQTGAFFSRGLKEELDSDSNMFQPFVGLNSSSFRSAKDSIASYTDTESSEADLHLMLLYRGGKDPPTGEDEEVSVLTQDLEDLSLAGDNQPTTGVKRETTRDNQTKTSVNQSICCGEQISSSLEMA